MYTIYIHKNKINGKVYVGQTKHRPETRWKRDGKGYKTGIFRHAINKYGWDEFEHIIVKTDLTKDEADKLEIELIKYYKGLSISYNITDGGDGAPGQKMSEEARRKMSEKRKGRKLSKEWREHLSESIKGRVLSETHKLNISNSLKGKPKSEEAKLKMRQNHNYHDLKAVSKYDRLGNLICTYPSAAEASRDTGIYATHITRCLKGKRLTAGGFIWKYFNYETL